MRFYMRALGATIASTDTPNISTVVALGAHRRGAHAFASRCPTYQGIHKQLTLLFAQQCTQVRTVRTQQQGTIDFTSCPTRPSNTNFQCNKRVTFKNHGTPIYSNLVDSPTTSQAIDSCNHIQKFINIHQNYSKPKPLCYCAPFVMFYIGFRRGIVHSLILC